MFNAIVAQAARLEGGWNRYSRALLDRTRAFRHALSTAWRVVRALVLREARTRYGRRSAGYVWALLSPMMQLAVMIAIFTAIGRAPAAGDNIVVFFLTAILPIFLWRNVANRSATAIQANRALMTYPQVNAFEVVTARTLLELVSIFAVFGIFALGLYAFFETPLTEWVDRPLPLLAGLAALAFFCYGTAFLSSQIGRMFEPWSEITSAMGRILFFTSGVFFTLGSLPDEFRAIVEYNPLAHLIEWIRDAAIRDFSSDLYSHTYPLALGLAFLAVGLFIDWLYRISGHDMAS